MAAKKEENLLGGGGGVGDIIHIEEDSTNMKVKLKLLL